MPAPPPPNLANPNFLAGKAALACALALLGCRLLGNPDLVSATFVAVICVSPTVLVGIRRSTLQIVGSVIGGTLGAAAGALGVSAEVGIPVTVGLAVLVAFRLGLGSAYLIAAFSALIVQAVPRGSPATALDVRIVAVLIAAVAAFVANAVVSGGAYVRIFKRRLARIDAYVAQVLTAAAADPSPEALLPAFEPITAVQGEIATAIAELTVRRSGELPHLHEAARRAEALRRLVHVAVDVAWAAQEADLRGEAAALFAWAALHEGPPPGTAPTPAFERFIALVLESRALRR